MFMHSKALWLWILIQTRPRQGCDQTLTARVGERLHMITVVLF